MFIKSQRFIQSINNDHRWIALIEMHNDMYFTYPYSLSFSYFLHSKCQKTQKSRFLLFFLSYHLNKGINWKSINSVLLLSSKYSTFIRIIFPHPLSFSIYLQDATLFFEKPQKKPIFRTFTTSTANNSLTKIPPTKIPIWTI